MDHELISKWSRLLDSNESDKVVAIFLSYAIHSEPSLKTMGEINRLLLEKRNLLHDELKKFINKYAAIEALRKKLTAHKQGAVYKN